MGLAKWKMPISSRLLHSELLRDKMQPTKVTQLTLTLSFLHLKVMADWTSLEAWAMAWGISAGLGGTSSVLPYFTKVAKRGFANSGKKFNSNQINKKTRMSTHTGPRFVAIFAIFCGLSIHATIPQLVLGRVTVTGTGDQRFPAAPKDYSFKWGSEPKGEQQQLK